MQILREEVVMLREELTDERSQHESELARLHSYSHEELRAMRSESPKPSIMEEDQCAPP